jgi:Xaa-Pro dipeptidase
LVLPELELLKAKASPLPFRLFPYGENPAYWGNAFRKALSELSLDGKLIGVEPTRLRVLELRLLETGAPEAEFVSAETALAALRLRKDAAELAAMRRAVQIAQDALKATLPAVKVGVSEYELASELTYQMLRAGSEPELPFAPIVAGGPNSANPHSTPGERRLQPGDLLLFDWGASYQGYVSDLTRTFAIAQVDPEMARIAAHVKDANAAAQAAVRAVARLGDVDRAARAVIEAGGCGPQFRHRTGHGLGMEGHEEPYVYGENDLIMQPGMTFTIEPGIYYEERSGVRIEDNVAVTATGCDVLSDLPRELIVLGG